MALIKSVVLSFNLVSKVLACTLPTFSPLFIFDISLLACSLFASSVSDCLLAIYSKPASCLLLAASFAAWKLISLKAFSLSSFSCFFA